MKRIASALILFLIFNFLSPAEVFSNEFELIHFPLAENKIQIKTELIKVQNISIIQEYCTYTVWITQCDIVFNTKKTNIKQTILTI